MNRFTSNKHLRFTHIVLLLVVALLAAACQPAAIPQTGSAQEVAVEITETGVTVPQTAPAGIVTFTTRNTSQTPRSFTLARLNTDVTLEQFMGLLEQGEDMQAVELVTLVGGRNTPVGETTRFTGNLKEGTHVILAFPEGEGAPLFANFAVAAGDASQAQAPQADVQVALVDFAFGMPTQIQSGERIWEVRNDGSQWHHMIIVKLNEGVTVEDLQQMLESEEEPQGPPPWEEVAYFAELSPGERGWMTLNLEPGTYTAICFLPDFADGHAHAEKGMIQEFEVQ